MKNILVPVDFSEASRNAFLYALHLADYLNASITLSHVYHPSFDALQPIGVQSLDAIAHSKKEVLNRFKEEVLAQDKGGHEVQVDIQIGFAAEEIVAQSKKVDWIVMGKTGKNNLIEKLFGSISAHVSRDAHCPVILVPEQASFRAYRNILYASDYSSTNSTSMQKLVDFSTVFSGMVHLVHVQQDQKVNNFAIEDLEVAPYFKQEAVATELRRATINYEKVWEGINDYASSHEIDLVVVATTHRKFWQNLTHRSVSKEIIKHTNYPVMVLHF